MDEQQFDMLFNVLEGIRVELARVKHVGIALVHATQAATATRDQQKAIKAKVIKEMVLVQDPYNTHEL